MLAGIGTAPLKSAYDRVSYNARLERTQLAIAFSLVIVFSGRAQQTAPTETDTPRATPAGATFTVPAGWTMTTKGTAVVVDPPRRRFVVRDAQHEYPFEEEVKFPKR